MHSIVGPPSVKTAALGAIIAWRWPHSPLTGAMLTRHADPIDPVFALAFFAVEGQAGTAGAAVAHRNPGNLRHEPPYPTTGGFATFPTWDAGVAGWYAHMRRVYLAAGHTTVEAIVPIYAPGSDGNTPARYIEKVLAFVGAWRHGSL